MSRWPLFPVAFAIAFVLRRYLGTGDYIEVTYRALAVLVIVALAIQLVLSLVTRSRHRGAYVTTVILATILDPSVGLVLLVPLIAPLVTDLILRRRPGGVDWARMTALLNIVAAVILTFDVVSAGLRAAPDLSAPPIASLGPASAAAPDIYVILLDEYPRSDTLATVFGYDNTPFVDQMGALGFELAEESHSNYNATTLTLASMFAATQVPELLGQNTGTVTGWDLQRFLNRGRVLDWLHEAGYSITAITSGVTTDDLRTADTLIDTGQVTTFEASVMRAGVLPRFLTTVQADWLHAQQRGRIEGVFEELRGLASAGTERPRFVFAHVMSPHAPIVFDANGGPVGPHPCLPVRCTMWDGRRAPEDFQPMVDQLIYTNKLVVEAVTAIQAGSSRPPVIVVLSDHGSRYDDVRDPDEMFRNLFMSSTPGMPALFPDNATPINVIPSLLNAYAGRQLPLSSEESYFVQLNVVLDRGYQSLVPWPQT